MKLANRAPMPRAQALTLSSARRELWRKHHAMPTTQLIRELRKHEFHLSDYCRPYRSDHLRGVSLWYIRMIETELRKRGCLAPLTRLQEDRNAATAG